MDIFSKLFGKTNNDSALLIRTKALLHLVFSDVYMAVIYLYFTAFLFAMMFLVVFLKGARPKTNYERRVELIEGIGRKRMDKAKQNDNAHFEPGRVYSEYENASKQILKKTYFTTIFN